MAQLVSVRTWLGLQHSVGICRVLWVQAHLEAAFYVLP